MENNVLPIFTGEGISSQIMDVHYLFWFGGEINRLQVMNIFDLSGSWASKLIGQYRKYIPEDWVKWDTRTRSFKRESGFVDYVENYLNDDDVMACYEAYLRLVSKDNRVLSLPSVLPCFSDKLMSISSAINSRSWLRVSYVAKDGLDGSLKIAPSLVFKGYRDQWFVRGRCVADYHDKYPGFYNLYNIPVSQISNIEMLPNFQDEKDVDDCVDPGLEEVGFDLYLGSAQHSGLIRSYKIKRFLLPLFLLENNVSLLYELRDSSSRNLELDIETPLNYIVIHAQYKKDIKAYLKAVKDIEGLS